MQEWDGSGQGALFARRTHTIKLCSPGRRARPGALGGWEGEKVARSRGQPGHSLQYRGRGIEGRERGLAIPCAHATRGRGLPSLDARTLGNRQAAPPPHGGQIDIVSTCS